MNNATRPPGAHAIASWLRQNGYTAKVIDFCHALTTDQLVALTRKHIGPDTVAIGASSTFWLPAKQINRIGQEVDLDESHKLLEPEWALRAREVIQARYPYLRWVLGGANTWRPTKYDWIRFHDHPEDKFLKFMDELCNKTITRRAFDIQQMSSCWHDDIGLQSTEFLSVELGRGCQFKCKFCSYPLIGKKKNTYLRDEKLVEEELIANYERYGITNYNFVDDTVNESTEKIEALANIVQRLPFKLNWVGFNRIDLIGSNPGTIDVLKASGIRGTLFGIESFHHEAAKVVGKGWNSKYARDFYPELMEKWNHDVSVTMTFITGLPHEMPEDLASTQDWLVENNVHYWFFVPLFISRNFSGSEFSKNYHLYGYRFPKPLDDHYWVNDHWTVETAQQKAIELNFDPRRTEMVRTYMWEIGQYATLGYPLDQVINTKFKDFYMSPDAEQRCNAFVQRYYENQINS